MNAGVMKHVGEAISSASLNPKQKIVVLGISNWCTVKNKNMLIKKHVKKVKTDIKNIKLISK